MVKQAYADAAKDYLSRFSTFLALKAVKEYKEIA